MLRKNLSKPSTLSARNLRIGVVAAKYNARLVDALLKSTLDTLSAHGCKQIRTVRVPGSYEVPVVILRLAKAKKFDALIALYEKIRPQSIDHLPQIIGRYQNTQRRKIQTLQEQFHQ
jgi:6,7-dimethyl-8-ribityllumazine synthase